MAGLSNRQRAFAEEYLVCWNASEAARRAGYTGRSSTVGPRLLLNVGIQELIQKRLDEKAMSADEVLLRLAEHARGDIGNFLDITPMGFVVDLNKAKEMGLTHLIKKAKQHTTTSIASDGTETEITHLEVELYDAQAALVQLGRHHKLFTDNGELLVKNITVTLGDDE